MIYLDYNATTPVAQDVLDAMLPYFKDLFGNAASRSHLMGWDAKEAVDVSRRQIAGLIGAHPKEIVFTSGATESVNLALKGVYEHCSKQGKNHIITLKTEHKAVLDTCEYLSKYRNADISYLDVDKNGNIDLKQLKNSIRETTVLVAIMQVNNETGLIHPVEKIAGICNKNEVLFFTDATQAVGKIKVNPRESGIDLMAFSAHKIYGPKGIGALYIREGIDIVEQLNGGAHERKRRSGTLNVPGIVGFGKAAEIAEKQLDTDAQKLKKQRDYLENSLISSLKDVRINGSTTNRIAHVTNLMFKNVASEELLLALSTHIALSSGSACNSASVLPSHVLKAMHLSDDEALSSIRFSLGRPTTDEELEIVIEKVIAAVKRLRA